MMDEREEQGYIIENAEAIDLGLCIGAAATIIELEKRGWLV